MKKLIKIVLLAAVLAAYFIVVTPRAFSLYSFYRYYNELSKDIKQLKENNAAVDTELSAYQERYQDVNVSTNFDIAKTIAGLNGAEFSSVSSLITMNGKMFECSNVTSVDDVNFFNYDIEYMSFELNLINSQGFIAALNSSALTVHSLVVNEKEMKVTLVVDAVYQEGDDTVIKAFIDFADVVSICLKDDRKLCYFTTFDYSEALLDNIYAVLSDVKVTSATVVLHGRLEGAPGGVVVLPGASVFEPVGDVKAIDHLLKASGIPVIEYFEFAGYYLSQGKQNVLFVDQEASVINLIVYKDHVVTMQLCTEALLQQTVRALYNQYELTEVIDVRNLVVPGLLNYFDNINSVSREDVLPVLSLFAFTLTTLASPYIVDISRLDFSGNNNNSGIPEPEIKEEILPGAETVDSCKKPLEEVKGKRKKVRRKPDVPKEKTQHEPVAVGRRGFLKFLSVILVLLLAVVLVVSIAGNSILSFMVGQKQKSIADLTTIYQANQNTVQSYQRMEQSSSGNEICMSGVELAGKLDLSKSIDNYISVTNTGVNYVGYFKTERNAKAFLNNVKKVATITSSTVAKSKKGTYKCKMAAVAA